VRRLRPEKIAQPEDQLTSETSPATGSSRPDAAPRFNVSSMAWLRLSRRQERVPQEHTATTGITTRMIANE
jgi:hypothetical protein